MKGFFLNKTLYHKLFPIQVQPALLKDSNDKNAITLKDVQIILQK